MTGNDEVTRHIRKGPSAVRGCSYHFAIVLISSLWFVSCHILLVQGFYRSCDAFTGASGLIILPLAFFGWLCSIVYAEWAGWSIGRALNGRPMRDRLALLLLLSVGVVAITLAYPSIVISLTIDPSLFTVNCGGMPPAWWPWFIPIW